MKSTKRGVGRHVNEYLRSGATAMPRPENKPDLSAEDAERPRPGDGTKTAQAYVAGQQAGMEQVAAGAQPTMTMGTALTRVGSPSLASALVAKNQQRQQQMQQMQQQQQQPMA